MCIFSLFGWIVNSFLQVWKLPWTLKVMMSQVLQAGHSRLRCELVIQRNTRSLTLLKWYSLTSGMGKEIFRYFISLTGTTLNSTFRKTQATHKLTATTKWSYIFNFLKPWKTETTSCIYSTKLVLVNIIVREIFGKEKMGLRLVRRDYNNIFKTERVNSSGFKF